jgi:hypothetical protein
MLAFYALCLLTALKACAAGRSASELACLPDCPCSCSLSLLTPHLLLQLLQLQLIVTKLLFYWQLLAWGLG